MPTPNPVRRAPPRLLSAGRWLLGLVLTGAALPAPAQIVPETPRQLDADSRRAQREARRTPAPYKDSHLDVARTRLQRGDGDQPRPDGADALRYRHGAPVVARKKKFLSRGRKQK
ncbi:hypothetical protein ACFQ48_09290 [Hymenobacter caeli]|uniref:Uncharacterized protein n=1 Tax=Hymenobacter caeli TaxID=2735894 RepID=A0ABX2FMU9_9BACT|nr:hypothetical protein [Hymenobacter caeli]NRT18262.1 hypothetical protein [Hymenobacter caeli]